MLGGKSGVAPSVEQCLTGIGLQGRLRRCLSANEDAFSYATGGQEVYPIIILTYSPEEEYYAPTEEEVPDVRQTEEHWLCYPAEPIHVELVWLFMYSIEWTGPYRTECQSVWTIDEKRPDGDHPWLNGRGHPLECDFMEAVPYIGIN